MNSRGDRRNLALISRTDLEVAGAIDQERDPDRGPVPPLVPKEYHAEDDVLWHGDDARQRFARSQVEESVGASHPRIDACRDA